MSRNNYRTIILMAAAIIVLLLVIIFTNHGKKVSQQTTQATTQPTEQINDEPGMTSPTQPDINNEEFKLISSNVSCSSTSVNGVETNNCSGSIRVSPLSDTGMEPGLYKITEQTKLLQSGVEHNLNTLQQLSNEQATVRLTLATGSEDTLAEIRY